MKVVFNPFSCFLIYFGLFYPFALIFQLCTSTKYIFSENVETQIFFESLKEMELASLSDNFLCLYSIENRFFLEFELLFKLIFIGFQLHYPSDLFMQYQDQYGDIQSVILTPKELLFQTLECFGLPKDYVYGNGHWKDWRKKKME